MEMNWISVDDRLPNNNGEWCLVYADGAINCMGFYHGAFSDWCLSKMNNITSEITHWMPLPAAPVTK